MEVICLRLVAAPLWAGFQFYGISLEFPSLVPYDRSFRVAFGATPLFSFAPFRRAITGNRRSRRRRGQNFPHQPLQTRIFGRNSGQWRVSHSHYRHLIRAVLRLMDTSLHSGYYSGKEDQWRTINSEKKSSPRSRAIWRSPWLTRPDRRPCTMLPPGRAKDSNGRTAVASSVTPRTAIPPAGGKASRWPLEPCTGKAVHRCPTTTYAMNGDADQALPLIEHLLRREISVLSPAILQLDPDWDPIRWRAVSKSWRQG